MAPPRDLTENGTDTQERQREPIISPYATKYDPMSNVSSFKIIDSTLRGMSL